jgi:hypothetical protein
MITLKQWMEVIKYSLTDSSEYLWDCYGKNVRMMDYDSADGKATSTIIFSTDLANTVFEVYVCENDTNRVYRLFHPDYKDAYLAEAIVRNVQDMAWDDIPFIDLETDEDFLEKMTAIVNGKPYDNRVSIRLNLSDEDLLILFMMAHEQDITFNQLIMNLMKKVIAEHEVDTHDEYSCQ